MGRARCAVTDDDDVRVQRLEVSSGVFKCLTLAKRGSFHAEIDHVRGEAERRKFKTNPRPSGRLDEQVDDRFAAQGRDLFYRSFTDRFKGSGSFVDQMNLPGAEGFDVEEVSSIPNCEAVRGHSIHGRSR